jgi:hypothetical protein
MFQWEPKKELKKLISTKIPMKINPLIRSINLTDSQAFCTPTMDSNFSIDAMKTHA